MPQVEAEQTVQAVAEAVAQTQAKAAAPAPEESPAPSDDEASFWADLAQYDEDVMTEPADESEEETPEVAEAPEPTPKPQVAEKSETTVVEEVPSAPTQAPAQSTSTAEEMRLEEMQKRYILHQMQKEAQRPTTAPQPQVPDVQAIRNQALQQIAQNFTISEEESTALLDEPAKVLPQLLARAQLQAFEQSFATVMQQVPQLVHRAVQQGKQDEEIIRRFYQRWPKLKAHARDVLRVTQAYRATNPQAQVDQAIEEIGSMSHVLLKIPFDAPETSGSAGTPEVEQQQAPRPAGTGGVSAPQAPPKPMNPFEALAREWEQEDLD